MVTLSVDQSGDLHYGYFYCLHVQREDIPCIGQTPEWTVSRLPPRRQFHAWMYCTVVGRRATSRHECPVDTKHETGETIREFEIEHWGEEAGPFVPNSDYIFATAALAKQFTGSRLAGIREVPVKILRDPRSQAPDPELVGLSFQGRNFYRRRQITPKEGNRCPFCGHAPYICPVCDDGGGLCKKCGKQCLVFMHERSGPDDPRIVSIPTKRWILDGRNWDGSDFMDGNIITKRALDYLLSIHAAPFRAEPMLVDLRGCNAAQLKRLEDARKPIPPQGGKP